MIKVLFAWKTGWTGKGVWKWVTSERAKWWCPAVDWWRTQSVTYVTPSERKCQCKITLNFLQFGIKLSSCLHNLRDILNQIEKQLVLAMTKIKRINSHINSSTWSITPAQQQTLPYIKSSVLVETKAEDFLERSLNSTEQFVAILCKSVMNLTCQNNS